MKVHEIVAMAFAAVSTVVFAHDADTLAFYAFKEGDAGTSLSGKTITNAAGSAYSGTVTINSGTVEYRADIPGAYVFSGESYGETVVCENPQSVHFSGNSTSGSQLISFADLGTTVSSNDDFTVEFFFKYGDGDAGANKTTPVIAMNCGLVYNPDKAGQAGEGQPGLFGIVIHGNPDRHFDAYVVDRQHHRSRVDTNGATYYGMCLDDGLWHHAAVVYQSSTKVMTVYLDYGVTNYQKSSPLVGTGGTDKEILEDVNPLTLGNGGFRGLISCVRISKCARTTDTFLRCSSASTYYPETVFHWSLDGENGTALDELASPLSADPRVGQFAAKQRPRNGTGCVETYESGGDTIRPTVTNEIPVRKGYLVKSGDETLLSSTGAVRLCVGGDKIGTGLRIHGTNYFPVVSGSWTMEGWFKMDYDAWKEKVVDTGYSTPQVNLFNLNYGAAFTGSQMGCYLVHQSDGFKMKLYVMNEPDPGNYNVGFSSDWRHFAVVHDAAVPPMTAYVDGEPRLTISLSKPFAVQGSEPYRHFFIGCGAGKQIFEGLIDEVRLVRKALSPSEFISFSRPPSGLMLFVK